MDLSRVLLVPFHATNLILVGIFSLLLTFCLSVGFYGLFAAFFLLVWVFKYCYVLIEHLADGSSEPPVMDVDMLSVYETRPWIQAALLFGGAWLCYRIGGNGGLVLGFALLAIFPATVAILGFGEPPWQVVNPVSWIRVMRGLGPYYLGLLLVLGACGAIVWLLAKLSPWSLIQTAVELWCVVAFYSLVGASIFVRRRQLGYEPSRSPERTAARAEAERLKLRARMVDDVFQLVRIGKHVDATAPLAKWLRDTEPEHAAKDSYHLAEQALKWETPAALNPIGSTLIRHLMRFGRPDAALAVAGMSGKSCHLMRFGRPDTALAVFESIRAHAPNFTMDSANDLRSLADYAESIGREALAQSMRLETPIFQPGR